MVTPYSNSEQIEIGELFGLTEQHLVSIPDTQMMLHRESLDAFMQMQAAAAEDGISIRPVSAYRSFERQLAIWNAKASGARDCLDDKGNCLDITELNDIDLVHAIMRFSALPGASRHHWGTDLDIYDAAAVEERYQPQLLASEYGAGGPFHNLHLWLNGRADDFGFSQPYQVDQGGIAPEPWHISHQQVAKKYAASFDLEKFADQIESTEIMLKNTVLDNLQYLFERYIQIT